MARKEASAQPDRRRPVVSGELETLNFKVPAAFKKAFKGYAVAQGITMLELLREGFELSKAHRGR